jgi:hypothetical protein
VFLIADTLTLKFDEKLTFVALDAYSNAALWERTEAVDVETVARGHLRIDWRVDSDRVRLPGAVRYTVSPDLRRLLIFVDQVDMPAVYTEVGSGLLLGLAGDMLRDIIITNISWR